MPTSAGQPVIEFRDVVFQYPGSDFALSIDHWAVDAGQQIACVGPSGSGKTTLLQLLAGTLSPQSGSIRVLDSKISDSTDAQRRSLRLRDIGMVWQEFALLDHLSVIENVLLPLRLDRTVTDLRPHRHAAGELLGQLGLQNRVTKYPATLSQGERQRVAVARALVRTPRLLLADEPTGNLDPSNKRIIVDLLLDYASTHSATLVFVTHDHSLLENFSHTVDITELNSHTPTGQEDANA
jgi:putative ABC transport system ATP-binding protein